MTNDLVELITN